MVECVKQKNIAKIGIIVLIVAVVAGYSYFKFHDFLAGPIITLVSPIDGASLNKELVMVKGKAERISAIFLNGRKIFTDKTGAFNEPILLSAGYNMMEVSAEDQFGRKTSKKLQLVYNPNQYTKLN